MPNWVAVALVVAGSAGAVYVAWRSVRDDPLDGSAPQRTFRLAELWMRRRGWHRLADALARWDERGLGR